MRMARKGTPKTYVVTLMLADRGLINVDVTTNDVKRFLSRAKRAMDSGKAITFDRAVYDSAIIRSMTVKSWM